MQGQRCLGWISGNISRRRTRPTIGKTRRSSGGAKVVRTTTSPWYSPGPHHQGNQPQQPAGVASGEGSIMTVLPGIWGSSPWLIAIQKDRLGSAATFPAQTLDLVERQTGRCPPDAW